MGPPWGPQSCPRAIRKCLHLGLHVTRIDGGPWGLLVLQPPPWCSSHGYISKKSDGLECTGGTGSGAPVCQSHDWCHLSLSESVRSDWSQICSSHYHLSSQSFSSCSPRVDYLIKVTQTLCQSLLQRVLRIADCTSHSCSARLPVNFQCPCQHQSFGMRSRCHHL